MSNEIRFVIPAAGKATRFNGIPKELLPIGPNNCGLTNAVRLANQIGHCSPVVVTNREKSDIHRRILVEHNLDASIVVEHDHDCDMWGSVLQGIDPLRQGGVIMPDTIPVIDPSLHVAAPLVFGCFVANEPYRFSCLDLSGQVPTILTKPRIAHPMLAWGVVAWDEITANLFLTARDRHFDRAFESVMRTRGFGIVMLQSYSDVGAFDHYKNYLRTT